MISPIKHLHKEASAGELQRHGAAVLRDAGIENPQFDARVLLAGCLNLDMAALLGAAGTVIGEPGLSIYLAALDERCSGKPVHRILGYREFYGRRFSFGKDCLEPRPETELLVSRILEDFDKSADVEFAEIGVGSGAIAVTLLAELPVAKAVASDIAAGALEAARKNAVVFGVADRLALVETDCLEGIEPRRGMGFDFIVSNPPYIASPEIGTLSDEVRLFDPLAALDGGEDGLDIYRRILRQSGELLKPSGRLYLETGHGQHDILVEMAKENGWGIVSRHLDLSGLERIVVLQWQANQ